jgi:hypothetical protein
MVTAVHAHANAAVAPVSSFMPVRAGVLQRSAGPCDCDVHDEELLQRSPAERAELRSVPAIVHEVLSSPGQPLDPRTRTSMEASLGHEFHRVRIHTDHKAAASAHAVNALAYTVADDVVFGRGQYNPATTEGQRLLAHELVHVVQQAAASPLPVAQDDSHHGRATRRSQRSDVRSPANPMLATGPIRDRYEREADQLATTVISRAGAGPSPREATTGTAGRLLQRQQGQPGQVGQQGQAPPCPSTVDFSSPDPVHVPACGSFRARSDVGGVTWSLHPNPTVVDAATTIAANGAITIAPTQAAGGLKARATATTGCFAEMPFRVRSHPTGIASTVRVSAAGPPDFGGVFDHVFISADGNVASLDNVGVGERFIGIPTPAAAQHAILAPLNPFGGSFNLHTATLTPGGTNNWFLTNAGTLGGTQDSVTIGRAGINVGRFLRSASNPNPPRALPADMTIRQGLHWFCPQAPAANRWRMPQFVTVAHSRTLRNRGGVVEFVTTVNGLELVQIYDGPVGVFNAIAAPVSTPRSAAPPAAPRTVRVTVDTLPSALAAGQALTFSIVGAAAGSTVVADPANDHGAILTIGTTAGTVTVQAADATGTNLARVTITVT